MVEDPDVGDRLLVADFTSTLLSRPVNISSPLIPAAAVVPRTDTSATTTLEGDHGSWIPWWFMGLHGGSHNAVYKPGSLSSLSSFGWWNPPKMSQGYAALYCSSGKNLGPAGVCLVIAARMVKGRRDPKGASLYRLNSQLQRLQRPSEVRRDLLDMALPQTPMILHRGGWLGWLWWYCAAFVNTAHVNDYLACNLFTSASWSVAA